MKEKELNGDLSNLGDILNEVAHSGQPHTILGKRGQQVMTLKDIQICECFLRGMLDGGTRYNLDEDDNLTNNIRPEKLEYHHLIDIIYKVKWLKDFDPVAIIQCASIHLEKVLGIYPNIEKLEMKQEDQMREITEKIMMCASCGDKRICFTRTGLCYYCTIKEDLDHEHAVDGV